MFIHKFFYVLYFLRVQEELLELNWNLLARRRRGKCWHNMPRVARFAEGGTVVDLLRPIAKYLEHEGMCL